MMRAVKRPLRISLRVLAGFATLVVTTVILCLDGVDNRPYFREPYYLNTAARLRASAETNTVARGELTAGFGRARLSPKVNTSQDVPAQGGSGRSRWPVTAVATANLQGEFTTISM